MNKLLIGLVLFFAGIVIIVFLLNVSADWSMDRTGPALLVLTGGGLSIIVGLILLVLYFISWLAKRKH